MDIVFFILALIGIGICLYQIKSGAIDRWAERLKAKAERRSKDS